MIQADLSAGEDGQSIFGYSDMILAADEGTRAPLEIRHAASGSGAFPLNR